MRKASVTTATLFVLLAVTRTATAAMDSVQLQVSVQVVPNCRIHVTDLAFGSYDPLQLHSTQPLDGTADVSVLCTKAQRATILFQDNGSAGRTMRSADGEIAYAIYSDASRTKTWGTGANAVQVVGTGSTPQRMTVYGRVPGSQIVPAGSYRDAVTATVDF